MRQLRALLAASFCTCFLLITIATAQIILEQTLQPGIPVERELSSGQNHTYTVKLEENQLIELTVEQRGIDVVVTVASPAGKSLGTFDSPNGDNGPENVSFVANAAGVYRFTVSPLNQQGEAGNGKYEIKIVEIRQATEQEIKSSKNLEVAKTKGIALLAEIDELIPEIHSPQTRIKAQLQVAQLLWDTDEKRAWKYLNDATAGVKEFLATLEPTTYQDYARTYSAVTQLRFEIIQMMAGRDPDAALSFLYSTKLPPNPSNNPREQADQERGLEVFIVNQIVYKDPKRAVQIARKTLKNGYDPSLMNAIANLRAKEPQMAAELANEVASKLLNEELLKRNDAASLTPSLMGLCVSQPMGFVQSRNQHSQTSEPMISEATCHDLVQKVYDAAMAFKPPPMNTYSPQRDAAWNMFSGLRSLGQNLDNIVPGGAAAVEKKFAEMNGGQNPFDIAMQQMQTKMNSGQIDTALEAIQKVPDEMKEQAYIQFANMLAGRGDSARARQIINDYVSNPFQKRQALSNLEQQEMYQSLQHGKVEEALKAIANLRTPRERANMLLQIARQIGPGHKRAVALSLLEQARAMLAPGVQAQDQEQMNALLELSRAFARYDPKRAFEIVDPLVDQLNDLCTAARTLDGFGMQFYEDDELDLQNGDSVAVAALQVSNALGTLAIANFDRAKLTTDKLRLPEVRLRAYLQIAQQTIQGDR